MPWKAGPLVLKAQSSTQTTVDRIGLPNRAVPNIRSSVFSLLTEHTVGLLVSEVRSHLCAFASTAPEQIVSAGGIHEDKVAVFVLLLATLCFPTDLTAQTKKPTKRKLLQLFLSQTLLTRRAHVAPVKLRRLRRAPKLKHQQQVAIPQQKGPQQRQMCQRLSYQLWVSLARETKQQSQLKRRKRHPLRLVRNPKRQLR